MHEETTIQANIIEKLIRSQNISEQITHDLPIPAI